MKVSLLLVLLSISLFVSMSFSTELASSPPSPPALMAAFGPPPPPPALMAAFGPPPPPSLPEFDTRLKGNKNTRIGKYAFRYSFVGVAVLSFIGGLLMKLLCGKDLTAEDDESSASSSSSSSSFSSSSTVNDGTTDNQHEFVPHGMRPGECCCDQSEMILYQADFCRNCGRGNNRISPTV